MNNIDKQIASSAIRRGGGKITLTSLIFWVLFFSVSIVGAYEIRDTDTEITGDFVINPAKVEVFLDGGSSVIETISILNRTDEQLEFRVEVEDFIGSQDPSQTVVLLGDKKRIYSLEDYLIPEIKNFSLKPGQKMLLPITVNIPRDVGSGGLYGSVLVSSHSLTEGAGTTIISRLGSLFFVSVNGEAIRDGELTSFTKLNSEEKISFQFLFENNGNVHLTPAGSVEIFNFVGAQVGEVKIPAYFAMPDSVRCREIEWNKDKLFGRYKAVISLDRGYENLVDELVTTFWVLPIKSLIIFLLGVFLFLFIVFRLIRFLK